MDLITEDKAKEILDFLARKAGYCKLSIKRKFSHDKSSKPFVIVCKPKLDLDDMPYGFCYQLYAAHHSRPDFLTISIKSMSYANALKTMLKLSRSMKDIFCRNNLILPVHTSLEEILIEMDLENGLDRR